MTSRSRARQTAAGYVAYRNRTVYQFSPYHAARCSHSTCIAMHSVLATIIITARQGRTAQAAPAAAAYSHLSKSEVVEWSAHDRCMALNLVSPFTVQIGCVSSLKSKLYSCTSHCGTARQQPVASDRGMPSDLYYYCFTSTFRSRQ